MGIRICLDEVLKKKGMTSKELCRQVGITEANLSVLRSRKSQRYPFAYDESYLLFPSM